MSVRPDDIPGTRPAAGGGGVSRHVAEEGTWRAVASQPDFCRVGKDVLPFDSFAIINAQQRSSPDVDARAAPVYREGDLHRGVLADAGSHVRAGTSLGSGHVKFVSGQDNVLVNGQPVVRHDSQCLVNCNAQGIGGARGSLITSLTTIDLRPRTEEDLKYHGEEVRRANERADEITRQLEATERELGETSWWNPNDWDARSEIKGRIENLRQQQAAADQWVQFNNRQLQITAEALNPGGPWLTAGPSASDRRVFAQRQLQADKYKAMVDGGPFATMAIMGGASPEVALAINDVLTAGSGRSSVRTPSQRPRMEVPNSNRQPAPRRERPQRPPPETPPAQTPPAAPPRNPGVFVKPRTESWRMAPNPQRWQDKGGKVEELPDGRVKYTDANGTSVIYSRDGYPDFSPHLNHPSGVRQVDNVPGLTGHNTNDFSRFNEAAGLPYGSRSPPGYTWHHVEGSQSGQLVPRDIHRTFTHSGGASDLRNPGS